MTIVFTVEVSRSKRSGEVLRRVFRYFENAKEWALEEVQGDYSDGSQMWQSWKTWKFHSEITGWEATVQEWEVDDDSC